MLAAYGDNPPSRSARICRGSERVLFLLSTQTQFGHLVMDGMYIDKKWAGSVLQCNPVKSPPVLLTDAWATNPIEVIIGRK